MGDNEDMLSEAAEGRGTCARTLEDHVVGLGLVMWHVVTRLASSGFPRGGQALAGAAGAWNFHKYICYHHIHVLLIKTNPMIYICYIKYGGRSDMCARCRRR